MVNNSSPQRWHRLNQKQLNQQFVNKLRDGMQCSQFEAKAILDTVYEVFDPYFSSNGSLHPGQIQMQCAAIDNSPQTKLADCTMVTVTLTLDAGSQDLEVRKTNGVIALRRHRLERICNEAFQQGGLLTVEDISYRVLNCGQRTIVRDIRTLKDEGVILPLRSTIKDMGRSISHRSSIVRHWLEGKEYSQIARRTNHSIEAIQNYVNKFQRVIALAEEGYEMHTIGFLVKISPTLAKTYFQIYQECKIVDHREKQLQEILKKTSTEQPFQNLLK